MDSLQAGTRRQGRRNSRTLGAHTPGSCMRLSGLGRRGGETRSTGESCLDAAASQRARSPQQRRVKGLLGKKWILESRGSRRGVAADGAGRQPARRPAPPSAQRPHHHQPSFFPASPCILHTVSCPHPSWPVPLAFARSRAVLLPPG